MLYKRYDWCRPVLLAAVCLTFFLGSQNSFIGIKDIRSVEPVKETKDESHVTEQRLKESIFSSYYYFVKQ
jgi:hypothetical protein